MGEHGSVKAGMGGRKSKESRLLTSEKLYSLRQKFRNNRTGEMRQQNNNLSLVVAQVPPVEQRFDLGQGLQGCTSLDRKVNF